MPMAGLRYFRRKGTHFVQVFAALVFVASGTIVLGERYGGMTAYLVFGRNIQVV